MHPAMVLCARFCLVCSLEKFVSDVMGNVVLYVAESVSVAFPSELI